MELVKSSSNAHPNDEGMQISQYTIFRDTIPIDAVGWNINSYVDDDSIVNGVTHSYQILAHNIENGVSALSSAVQQSASAVPDAPAQLQAVHGDSEVMLSWDFLHIAPNGSPNDEGRPVLQYNIYQSSNNIAYTQVASVSGDENDATISGLNNGAIYYFKISASNINGEGAKSSNASAMPSTSPSVPTSVTIYPYHSGVEVSWGAPVTSGGLAYTYNVEIRGSGGGLAFQASNITNPLLNITSLDDNQS
jgi:hypothetical protein